MAKTNVPYVDPNSIAGQIAASQAKTDIQKERLTSEAASFDEANDRAMGRIGSNFRATTMKSFIPSQLEKTEEWKATQAMKQRAIDDPWSFYRQGAADKLAQTSGNDPSEIYRKKLEAMSTGQFGIDDPSYKFRFDQGQKALERSQASKGLLGSGNAAVELQQYGQGAASQEYQAQFQRMLQGMGAVEEQYNSQQARLMQLAGVQTPGVQAGITGGIQQSQIGAAATVASAAIHASASNNSTAENARQFNVQAAQNDQYQAGLSNTLASAGWNS